MNYRKLLSSPLSPTVAASSRARRRELGKTRNATLSATKRTKNNIELVFIAPATYSDGKYKITVLISGKDIKLDCSCSAFALQGFRYRLDSVNGSIKSEKREDKRWRRYHGSCLTCKHVELLLKNTINKRIIEKEIK